MVMMIPAPGTYYGRERYFNQIRIEPKVNYGFTVRKVNLYESFMHYVAIFMNTTKFRYNVYEKLNNSCNFQKNWGEDDCKLNLVNVDDIILLIT